MLSVLLCMQLHAGAGRAMGDSVYASAALERMVARAATENQRPPPELRSYRSQIET